jgi:hypothetical protein
LNVSGNHNTFLGSETNVDPAGTYLEYASAIGAGALVATSNAIVLGRSNDRVGIGTTKPSTALEVNGTISANRLMLGQVRIHASGANEEWMSNFFAGTNAGNYTMSGAQNVGLGYGVLSSNTTGENNNALGNQALWSNTSGGYNNALGLAALNSNTNGYNNNAIGQMALYSNMDGSGNNAIGQSTMQANTSGWQNNAIGANALGNNTSGYHNNAFGYITLQRNTSGIYNSAFGARAGSEVTGNYNTYIGAYSDQTYGIAFSYATAIGAGAIVGTSNAVVLGRVGDKVGIGTTSPNAVLEIASTTQGVVIPRMTKVQRDAIVGKIAGTLIYQTDNTPGLRVYNGANWMRFTETAD